MPLALFAALLTWLAIMAVSAMQNRRNEASGSVRAKGAFLATLIALSIGLHNFGEGLAVGAAFALGEAALGSFLVIGFILHNITEGIGIAAPLVPNRRSRGRPAAGATPSLLTFAGLALLAGFPAVLGTWIGGFAFSPLLGTIFLGIGLGAIWQVIVEVTGAAAPLRGTGEHALGLLAQPGRFPARPGDHVLYRVSGEVLKKGYAWDAASRIPCIYKNSNLCGLFERLAAQTTHTIILGGSFLSNQFAQAQGIAHRAAAGIVIEVGPTGKALRAPLVQAAGPPLEVRFGV